MRKVSGPVVPFGSFLQNKYSSVKESSSTKRRLLYLTAVLSSKCLSFHRFEWKILAMLLFFLLKFQVYPLTCRQYVF